MTIIVSLIIGGLMLGFAVAGFRTSKHNGALRVMMFFMAWFAAVALASWLYLSLYVFPYYAAASVSP